jgi:hypothetical protein
MYQAKNPVGAKTDNCTPSRTHSENIEYQFDYLFILHHFQPCALAAASLNLFSVWCCQMIAVFGLQKMVSNNFVKVFF